MTNQNYGKPRIDDFRSLIGRSERILNHSNIMDRQNEIEEARELLAELKEREHFLRRSLGMPVNDLLEESSEGAWEEILTQLSENSASLEKWLKVSKAMKGES